MPSVTENELLISPLAGKAAPKEMQFARPCSIQLHRYRASRGFSQRVHSGRMRRLPRQRQFRDSSQPPGGPRPEISDKCAT